MRKWREALSLLTVLAMLLGASAAAAEEEYIYINEESPVPELAAPAEDERELLPEETPAPEVQEPNPWSDPMPVAPEPELRSDAAEPRLVAEEGWSYDADARELVIVHAPDAQELVLRWEFDGDAVGYRVEIGPDGGECGQELFAELECDIARVTLDIADYPEEAYRLCIHAVLEDGSERTGAYRIRLEEAAAEEPEATEAEKPTVREERVEQVLAQSGVIVTGRMPLGAELTVQAMSEESLTGFVGSDQTIVFAFAIEITANGQVFVPEEPLTVTVALNEVGVSSLDVLRLAEADGAPCAQTIVKDVPVGSAAEFSTDRLGILFGAAVVQPVPEGEDYLLASNSIHIYSQGSRDYIGMTSCLQQYRLQRAGCGVFAVAHALQWMGCDNWTNLDDFLEQIAELTHPADYGYAFAEGVNAIYPDFTLGSISPNEGAASYYSKLRELFDAGGCGMFSYEGHYILVIGFSSDGSKIHIIDSSTGSTLSHLGGYHAYYCDPLSKQWVTISPVQSGAWNVPGRYSSSGTWEGMKSYGREYWVDREYVYYGNKNWYGGVPMITFTPCEAPERRLYTTVGQESCTYRMSEDAVLRAEPFDSAEAVDALQAGDRIVSCEVVDNGADYWLRIEEKISAGGESVRYDAAYIYAGYDNSGSRQFDLIDTRPGLEWQEGNIDGMAITGTTSVTGTISCANRMTRITAEFRKNGVRVGDAVSVTPTANRQYSYALHGSTLDTGLRFASLPDGNYQLVFTVDYSYNCNQSYGRGTIVVNFTRMYSTASSAAAPQDGPWVYRVVAEGGLNMRRGAQTGAELVATLWSPTTVTVTRKLTADGYTWGYGTTDSGVAGWIVVDNEWTELLDAA